MTKKLSAAFTIILTAMFPMSMLRGILGVQGLLDED